MTRFIQNVIVFFLIRAEVNFVSKIFLHTKAYMPIYGTLFIGECLLSYPMKTQTRTFAGKTSKYRTVINSYRVQHNTLQSSGNTSTKHHLYTKIIWRLSTLLWHARNKDIWYRIVLLLGIFKQHDIDYRQHKTTPLIKISFGKAHHHKEMKLI